MFGLLKGRLVAVRTVLLTTTLLLTITGITAIYAVGHPRQAEQSSASEVLPQKADTADQTSELANLWKKQLFFAAIGFAALVVVNLVSYRRLGEAGYWIYAMVIAMLAVLLADKIVDLPFVSVVNGSRRWLHAGAINIQPSEICKPAYLLALAWYLRYRSNYRNFRALIGPFILTLLSTILILLEPDLGTVLLIMPVFFVMLFIAGAKPKHLATIILAALLISPLLWHKMQPYQRLRISSVLLQNDWLRQKAEQHPAIGQILVGTNFSTKKWKDDWGYHLIRSKYAVASGGLTGYGFRQGPFIKYNFLPERHNDFIFAIIAHQWGFLGCIMVLMIYVILLWCGLEIARTNSDPFGRLLAAGIVAMFAIQIIVNMTMTLGLMPITGLTLPFLSYGGSSLIVSMVCVGLLNNIGRGRTFIVAPRR
ncbi:MAG: FtsW/RodA/SpoVE family cell cycle protein [Sedimentisphaerales bacterium]|jgi:cell division protein FtsW (lipid II flippase)